jgi:prolyl oligopeptidase
MGLVREGNDPTTAKGASMTDRWHLLALGLLLVAAGILPGDPPATKKRRVTDVYHGTPVTDDYRWLEDASSGDVRAWSDAQNAHARRILDGLPGVVALRRRITTILGAPTTSHSRVVRRSGTLFALRRQPPRQQPFLVAMPGPFRPDRATVIVDPSALDPKGGTAIDWYAPSPDGKLVAVSLSAGGSESGDVHVFEAATGKQVFEVVPRVNGGTAGGDVAWAADGKGFFYTRYPRGKERAAADRDFYQQVYFHELGTPTDADRYEVGKELPRTAEVRLQTHLPTGRVLAAVQDGDSGRFAHYLRSPEGGGWRPVSSFADGVVQAAFGPNDDLYLVSRRGAARGRMLRLNVRDLPRGTAEALARARAVIPEGAGVVVTDFYGPPTFVATANRLYVTYQLGGPSELRAFDLDGRPQAGPKQLPVGAAFAPVPLGGDDILFGMGSFVQPPALYVYRAASAKVEKAPLTSPPVVDFADVRVVRQFATSKDGTRVPVNVLIPGGVKADGKNPCLVTAYGGFGISVEPRANALYRILFDHGFVVAVANLRGGGEFGEAWHQAGVGAGRQKVYDDFAAVLRHVIEERYTSPERLAILGGSNGGLLMGVALTQHPELVKAVVARVGIFDVLRNELTPNGSFNVPEYGTVKDEAQFRALLAYSPYHNVRDGVKYPATLLLTGANDPRVDPMHSRKMTARLQAATAGGAPVLLRTSAGSGHGLDTALSARIEEEVDVFAFLFAQLGVKVKAGAP